MHDASSRSQEIYDWIWFYLVKSFIIPSSTTLAGRLPFALPASATSSTNIIEEDDEFLRKKAIPVEKPPPPRKGPVKISIPSLSDFKDLDKEDENRPSKKMTVLPMNNKPSGLLNLLPRPKAEQFFQSSSSATVTEPGTIPKTTTRSLVPHSVAKRTTTTMTTTSVVDKTRRPVAAVTKRDEEVSSDEEGGHTDFFSLAQDDSDCLPEVSRNEINLMVAKRAAKIAATTAKFEREAQQEAEAGEERRQRVAEEEREAQECLHRSAQSARAMDAEALQLLVGGSRAKRARMADLDMIELSHEQVMPSRDEWMRTAVASSTTAQVRGQLKDGPKGVAKKKHQITYLAHQAKSNEAELQAIWAANRTTQRQSQSKYGW